MIKQIGCQISVKESKRLKKIQENKNTTVSFEKTDKKVSAANGAPP